MVFSRKKRRPFTISQTLLTMTMSLLALTMLVPLLNIIANSFSHYEKSPFMSGLRVIPDGFTLMNYKIVLSNKVILPALMNSILITSVGTLINILMTTTAAYALCQPKLLGKRALMVFLIIMMLLDPGLVPEYLVIMYTGLMGSRWSMILLTSVSVYYLVIMMRYFRAVPGEIYDSARIDGAGHFRTLFSIVYPLAKSGIATVTMFYAVVRWNEFFKTSIYISDVKKTTLQVILRQYVVANDTISLIGDQSFHQYQNIVDMNALKNATIVIAIVPILLLYPIILKYYTKDIMGGGLKE